MMIRIAIAIAALCAVVTGAIYFTQANKAPSEQPPEVVMESTGQQPAFDADDENLAAINAAGPRVVAPGIRQMEMRGAVGDDGRTVMTMVLEIPMETLSAARTRLHKLLPEKDQEACLEGAVLVPAGSDMRVEVVDLEGEPYMELGYEEFVCVEK